jgi:hypothetical protein
MKLQSSECTLRLLSGNYETEICFNVTSKNNRRQQAHLIRYDVAKLQDMTVKKVCQNRIETWCQNHELMKELASDTGPQVKQLYQPAEEVDKRREVRAKTVGMIKNVLK